MTHITNQQFGKFLKEYETELVKLALDKAVEDPTAMATDALINNVEEGDRFLKIFGVSVPVIWSQYGEANTDEEIGTLSINRIMEMAKKEVEKSADELKEELEYYLQRKARRH